MKRCATDMAEYPSPSTSPSSLYLPQIKPRQSQRHNSDVVLDVRMTKSSASNRGDRGRSHSLLVTAGTLAGRTNSPLPTEFLGQPFRRLVSETVPSEATAYESLLVDSDLKSTSSWPTRIVEDSHTISICELVVNQVKSLCDDIHSEGQDNPSKIWDLVENRSAVLDHMLGTGDKKVQADLITTICENAQYVLSEQPAIVECSAPAKVFGDVHGQFRDMLLLMSKYGFPHHREGDIDLVNYVFNGDWVDRGPHQLETVLFLFAIKVLYPTRVYLVRGNHEFRVQNTFMTENGIFGFDRAMYLLFPPSDSDSSKNHLWGSDAPESIQLWERLFEAVHNAFDYLPLACVIEKKIVVIHGGLGDGSWSLADLSAAIGERPLQTFTNSTIVFNAVWSDPIPEDGVDAFQGGVHTNGRDANQGGIKSWGMDVSKEWLKREGVSVLIRSHEYHMKGLLYMHGGHVITVFSARNYDGRNENDGALLLIFYDDNKNLRIRAKTVNSYQFDHSSDD